MIDRRDFLKTAIALAASNSVLVYPRSVAAVTSTKLLFVHGRGQQTLDPIALKTEWLKSLGRGATAIGKTLPGDLDVAFPYYGDTLDGFARQFDLPLASEIRARGEVNDEFLEFQAEMAEEVRRREGVTNAQLDAEYGNNSRARGPLNWEWVQAILRAIDKYGFGMNQKTLEAFTRDVFLYTRRAGVRDEINRIVAATLTDQPTVVVGHSLGTVVAYSVLRSDPRTLAVPLFVTVGSPLGVRAIRSQFLPLKSPESVGSWYNAFDPRDVVALYPLDAGNFSVEPAIENYAGVRNATDNRHGIVGYLDDPDVARRILNALGV